MTNNMTCPACGAVIDTSSGQNQIRCEFCGTELGIYEEEGERRSRLLSQSDSQKNMLDEWTSQPAIEGVEGAPLDEVVSSEAIPSADVIPETPAAVGTQPDLQAYQAARQPVSDGGSGYSGRWWIAIVVGAIVLLCGLCACIIGSVVLAGSLFT